MRILHLVDRLTDRGGAYRHLLGVLEHQRLEHDVHLAVGNDDGTVTAPCPITIIPALESRARESVELEPLHQEFGPDVIHVHTVLNPAVLDWAADRGGVITVQDHRFFCPGRGKWTADGRPCKKSMSLELCAGCFSEPSYFHHIYSLTEERLRALRNLRIVVLSHYMKGELVAAGIAEDRIATIPPFVHALDLDATADGPPCILFVGRLVEAKGAGEAVTAWKRSGISLPLVVAGTGPLRAELEGRDCEVMGWVSHRSLSALYRRAEALVLPFRWQEPFGIVGLEALTMGVPVVAWQSGGVNGWHPGPGLVPWGDLDGLAAELRLASSRTVEPPSGFEPGPLMNRLQDFYVGNETLLNVGEESEY